MYEVGDSVRLARTKKMTNAKALRRKNQDQKVFPADTVGTVTMVTDTFFAEQIIKYRVQIGDDVLHDVWEGELRPA